MRLDPHMGGDQADDAFRLGRVQMHARIDSALAQPVEPQRTVGIDHHLDDGRIGKGFGDCRTQGGAQHDTPPVVGLGMRAHPSPPPPLSLLSDLLPEAIWRPTCSTNLSKRSWAIAWVALSGTGVWA